MADLNDALNTVLQHATGIWISLDVDGTNVFKLLTLGSTSGVEETLVTTGVLNIRTQAIQSSKLVGQTKQGDTVVVSGTFYDATSKVTYAQLKSINGTPQSGYIGRKGADGEIWLVPPSVPVLTIPEPPVVSVPPPPPVSTSFKIGAHIMWGGNYSLLTAWAQMGKLPGVTNVKTAGRGDHLLNQTIKQASNNKTLILQRWYNEHDPLPGPDWSNSDLHMVGINYFNAYYDLYLKNDPDRQFADWHQIINEPTAIGPGVPSFWMGAMQAAEALNCKLAVGCYSVGFPLLPSAEDGNTFWAPMWDALRYAKAHGHVWMRHGYIVPDIGGNWTDPNYMLRHRLELTAQGLSDMPVIYGEYGTANGAHMDDDTYLNGIKSAQAELQKDVNVLFVSLWTCGGGGGWPDSLIDGKLPRLIEYAKTF